MALKAVSAPLGSPVGGSGTPGTIPVWSGSGTTLTDSIITQSGSTVAIGLLRFAGNVLSTSSAELAIQYATSRDTTVYAPGSSIALFVKGTTGSVGIGTASPQEKAQVSGNLKVGVTASDSFITFGDEGTTSRFNGIYRPASSNTMAIGSYNLITFNVSAANLGSQTERGRFTTTSLDISATAGYGLKLPATPGNGDANTLDAYREGTRVLAAGDLSGWTYVTATQYWTLVGRTVTLHTVFTGGTSSATGGATIATPPLLTPLRIAAGAAANSAGTALGNGVAVVGPTSGTTGTVTTSNAISSSAVDKVITVTYETAGL